MQVTNIEFLFCLLQCDKNQQKGHASSSDYLLSDRKRPSGALCFEFIVVVVGVGRRELATWGL